MVRPAAFGYNDETAANNFFQHHPGLDRTTLQQKALTEFDAMVDLLRSHQVELLVLEDSKEPPKPDAVFPNNWISTSPDGKIFIYPMFAPNRRTEKRDELLEQITREYVVVDVQDWSEFEAEGRFLEGTGSMVIDYDHEMIYAAISERTNLSVLEKFATANGFQAIVFLATDKEGQPIYHTNVVMALGEKFASVVFSPIHIELIREAPEARRAFLDSAVISTKPAFAAVLREYDGVLYQRNNLLKRLQAGYNSELEDTLAAYTKHLAQIGARVYAARSRYTARLSEEAPSIYRNISGGEELEIAYKSSIEGGNSYGAMLYESLCRSAEEDIRNGFTGVGPHREDMELSINGQKARRFASQGQSKSAALCLKLAEGRILESAIGQKPVFLLDDVMSELDKNRQNYILENLGENQLFITGCDCAALLRRLPKGAVFTVKNGVVRKRGDKKRKCQCLCISGTTSMSKPAGSSGSST